jgi:hypothetical protein
MISKIISRAACLAELTSNSKSFFNCPDLHGGVPGLPGDGIDMKPALAKKIVPRGIAVAQAAYDRWLKFRTSGFGPVGDRRVSGNLFFRSERK